MSYSLESEALGSKAQMSNPLSFCLSIACKAKEGAPICDAPTKETLQALVTLFSQAEGKIEVTYVQHREIQRLFDGNIDAAFETLLDHLATQTVDDAVVQKVKTAAKATHLSEEIIGLDAVKKIQNKISELSIKIKENKLEDVEQGLDKLKQKVEKYCTDHDIAFSEYILSEDLELLSIRLEEKKAIAKIKNNPSSYKEIKNEVQERIKEIRETYELSPSKEIDARIGQFEKIVQLHSFLAIAQNGKQAMEHASTQKELLGRYKSLNESLHTLLPGLPWDDTKKTIIELNLAFIKKFDATTTPEYIQAIQSLSEADDQIIVALQHIKGLLMQSEHPELQRLIEKQKALLETITKKSTPPQIEVEQVSPGKKSIVVLKTTSQTASLAARPSPFQPTLIQKIKLQAALTLPYIVPILGSSALGYMNSEEPIEAHAAYALAFSGIVAGTVQLARLLPKACQAYLPWVTWGLSLVHYTTQNQAVRHIASYMPQADDETSSLYWYLQLRPQKYPTELTMSLKPDPLQDAFTCPKPLEASSAQINATDPPAWYEQLRPLKQPPELTMSPIIPDSGTFKLSPEAEVCPTPSAPIAEEPLPTFMCPREDPLQCAFVCPEKFCYPEVAPSFVLTSNESCPVPDLCPLEDPLEQLITLSSHQQQPESNWAWVTSKISSIFKGAV